MMGPTFVIQGGPSGRAIALYGMLCLVCGSDDREIFYLKPVGEVHRWVSEDILGFKNT